MPFLLSPAGSMPALRAAVDAGADEVYLGGPVFNARMNAGNFDRETLVSAASLCRSILRSIPLSATGNLLRLWNMSAFLRVRCARMR